MAAASTAGSAGGTALKRRERRREERAQRKARRGQRQYVTRGATPPSTHHRPRTHAPEPTAAQAKHRVSVGARAGKRQQGRRKAGPEPKQHPMSNFRRLLREQGLDGSVPVAGGRLEDEIDYLERKLGMRKRGDNARTKRELESEGLAFALDLDAVDRRPCPSKGAVGASAKRHRAVPPASPRNSRAGSFGRNGVADVVGTGVGDGGDDDDGLFGSLAALAAGDEEEGVREDDLDEGDDEDLGDAAESAEEEDDEEDTDLAGDDDDDEDTDLAGDDEDDEDADLAGDDDEEGDTDLAGVEDDDEDTDLAGVEEAVTDRAGEEAPDPGLGGGGERSGGGSRGAGTRAAGPGLREIPRQPSGGQGGRPTYVPPALRVAAPATRESEQRVELRRAIRGAVNRVSEANVAVVSAEVLRACAGASRSDAAELLSDAVLAACLSETLVLAPLTFAAAALVAALHWHFGSAVGAHVVEAAVMRFDAFYAQGRAKPCVNAALLLAHLYTLQIVHAGLIYDLISRLVGRLSELDVEVLLPVLRAVGFRLRADDPGALKHIVLAVARRAADLGLAPTSAAATRPTVRSSFLGTVEAATTSPATSPRARGTAAVQPARLSAGAVEGVAADAGGEGVGPDGSMRIRVLVQMVVDLKNNRQRVRDRDATADRVAALRRALLAAGGGGTRGGRRRKGAAGAAGAPTSDSAEHVELVQLRASWQDYANSETQGRWWILGRPWGGKAGVGASAGEVGPAGDGRAGGVDGRKPDDLGEEAEMMALARQQRMNTDVRRRVFVAIMGADDHVDGFERLAKLRLNRVQQRDVGRVLVDCCGQESAYNPYYAHLAVRLCESSPDFVYTLQYTYWDHFKQVGDYPVRRIANLARLLAYLLARGALPLAVLKGVDFGGLEPNLSLLLQMALVAMLADTNERALTRAVDKLLAVKAEGHVAVAEGLRLFCAQHVAAALRQRPEHVRDTAGPKLRILQARLDESAHSAR